MASLSLDLTRTNELKCTILMTPREVRRALVIARELGVIADALPDEPDPPVIEVAPPADGETPAGTP